MENQTTIQPQGKKLAAAGFVISLVALIGYFIVAVTVAAQALFGGGYGLSIFWLLFSIIGVALCIMGMMKLKATGGKKGLAIAGIVLGLIATVLTIMLVSGIDNMQKAGADFGGELKTGLEQGLEQLGDTAKLNAELDAALNSMTDSLSAH